MAIAHWEAMAGVDKVTTTLKKDEGDSHSF